MAWVEYAIPGALKADYCWRGPGGFFFTNWDTTQAFVTADFSTAHSTTPPDWVNAATSDGAVWYITTSAGLYKSNAFLPTSWGSSIAARSEHALLWDAGRLFAAQNDTIRVSDDGGSTWTLAHALPTVGSTARQHARIIAVGSAVYVTNGGSDIGYSPDHGDTWATIETTAPVGSLAVVGDVILAGGIGAHTPIISTDAGATWTSTGWGSGYHNVVMAPSGRTYRYSEVDSEIDFLYSDDLITWMAVTSVGMPAWSEGLVATDAHLVSWQRNADNDFYVVDAPSGPPTSVMDELVSTALAGGALSFTELATLISELAAQSALAGRVTLYAVAASQGGAAATMQPGLLVRVELQSTGHVSCTLLAVPIFLATLISQAAGAAVEAQPLPDEVWVLNTATSASTRYEGFDFSSFAKIDGRYYGCRSDGVYELDGDTDSDAPIQAMVSFGKQDFGTSALKRVSNIYVGTSSGGKLFVKVLVEGEEYLYQARDGAEELQVQRFDLGRGLRANYLEFELYNADGDDFELASVEFAAVPLSRRI